MNIKDQIRAEIERLKDTAWHRADNRYGREDANTYEAWAGAYEKVLEILDTIPEQPTNDFCKENCKGYKETGKCFSDGPCAAKQEASKEQPVRDHHKIEVKFRGEKVTISREFYRNGEMNYSTSEQDDNAIWSALRAWCEKKGITPFELYPKQSEQPVEGLEEEIENYYGRMPDDTDKIESARHFAEWMKAKMLKEAVEGTVCKDESDVWIELRPDALPNFKDMQPVKLIVKDLVEDE